MVDLSLLTDLLLMHVNSLTLSMPVNNERPIHQTLVIRSLGDSGEKSPRRFFRLFCNFLKEEKFFFQFFHSDVLH